MLRIKKKKRNVVQTAWAIPVVKRVSLQKKMQMPSPPDPDTFIRLKHVSPCAENPIEEVFLRNVNVVQRGIQRRTKDKISDLSNNTHTNEAEDAYDSSFVDDTEAEATQLT